VGIVEPEAIVAQERGGVELQPYSRKDGGEVLDDLESERVEELHSEGAGDVDGPLSLHILHDGSEGLLAEVGKISEEKACEVVDGELELEVVADPRVLEPQVVEVEDVAVVGVPVLWIHNEEVLH